MKNLILSFLVAGFLNITAAVAAHHTDHDTVSFDVHQHDYTFSTVFECHSDSDFFASVVKSSFRVRTNYDLYDKHGKYEGVGVCRLLTLGALYSWGTEIDLYDPNNNYIGMIDGQVMTGAGAKFSIYDRNNNRVAIAYLDLGSTGFSIVDANNESHHLANMKRHFVQDATDHWHVTVFDKHGIDMRAVKIFAAFAVDSQNNFKEDN